VRFVAFGKTGRARHGIVCITAGRGLRINDEE
jgi:hypothetical protein